MAQLLHHTVYRAKVHSLAWIVPDNAHLLRADSKTHACIFFLLFLYTSDLLARSFGMKRAVARWTMDRNADLLLYPKQYMFDQPHRPSLQNLHLRCPGLPK